MTTQDWSLPVGERSVELDDDDDARIAFASQWRAIAPVVLRLAHAIDGYERRPTTSGRSSLEKAARLVIAERNRLQELLVRGESLLDRQRPVTETEKQGLVGQEAKSIAILRCYERCCLATQAAIVALEHRRLAA